MAVQGFGAHTRTIQAKGLGFRVLNYTITQKSTKYTVYYRFVNMCMGASFPGQEELQALGLTVYGRRYHML